jgi:hypothetical protein
MFWPKLKDKVVGLVLVQSPYGGNPIAPDILCKGQIADVEICLMEVLICKIIKVLWISPSLWLNLLLFSLRYDFNLNLSEILGQSNFAW